MTVCMASDTDGLGGYCCHCLGHPYHNPQAASINLWTEGLATLSVSLTPGHSFLAPIRPLVPSPISRGSELPRSTQSSGVQGLGPQAAGPPEMTVP